MPVFAATMAVYPSPDPMDPATDCKILMPRPHTLPVPPALLRYACDTVSRRVSPLPFARRGITVDRDLIAAALESLNAEALRTLLIRHVKGSEGRVQADGLDRLLGSRGFTEPHAAPVIAQVLEEAGITRKTSVMHRRSHRIIRGTRLLPAWTWSIVSGPGTWRGLPGPPGDYSGGSAWTALCPVCRAGRLDPVFGERLFGVHDSEHLACSSCGAKFVPENGKFRLVSIVKKEDPLWADLLNRSFTPDEWQAIAAGRTAMPVRRPADQRPKDTGRSKRIRSADLAGSGQIAVEIGSRTLYFTKVPLVFGKGKQQDLFQKRRDPVNRILQLPAFRHLMPATEARYLPYLDHPVGPFLSDLKTRNDPFYRQFLHPYGDLAFCSFKAGGSDVSRRRGAYVVAAGGAIEATGAAFRPFKETIDDVLGAIPPSAVYLDGDPYRCRINSILCGMRNRGGIFIHPVNDDDAISDIAAALAARFPLFPA